MKKSEALHQLIHALSANEKRFFKIYASRHTIGDENNYVKLFSLFDNLKTFNEQTINTLVKKSNFIKYFAAEKNYLYNLILDCLDIYHKETSTDRQISKLVNTSRVLFEKKLDEQAAKILLKAKKIAQHHSRHESLLAINYLLTRKEFADESITDESLEDYQQTSKLAVVHLQTKQTYQFTYQTVQMYRRKNGTITNTEDKAEFTHRFPHLVTPVSHYHSLPFASAVYYLVAQVEFCRVCRDQSRGKEVTQTLIAFMESDKSKITGEFIDPYIYALYCTVVMRLYNQRSEAEATLDKLRHLDQYIESKVTKQEHARCFEFHFTAISDMYLETKEYHEVQRLLPDFERAFAVYQPHLTPSFILALHFNITCLFFGLEAYKEALKWSNKVRNADNSFRNDLFYNLRTLNMIIHLELGNLEILPSLIKSAAYHQKKGAPNTALQKSIMRCMKLILKSNSKRERQRIFEKLKEELAIIEANPEENHIFTDVDLVAWAEKKAVIG